MKKLLKGLLALGLLAGALTGCGKVDPTSSADPVSSDPVTSVVESSEPAEESSEETPVVTHYVEFYYFDVGALYLELEVADGEKVAKPDDPARAGYIFEAWFDMATEEEYDFDAPVVSDLELYGTWDREFVEDERDFHVAGDMANTDLSYIDWNDSVLEEVDERSYLEKAEGVNLYSIELEIGYLGKFKVKIPGRPWDSDTEFDFTHIAEADQHDYLQEADHRNIQVVDAGLYKIEVESTYLWAKVTRLGDVGEESGARPTPEEGEIPEWGVVGTVNGWGSEPDLELEYDADGEFYLGRALYLPEDAEVKLRADNTWGVEWGSHENNKLDAELFEQGLQGEEDDEPGEINPGANITVLVGGYYTVYFEDAGEESFLAIEPLSFALRGDAIAETGWGADSDKLELISAEDGEFVYEGTYEFGVGEFKVKFAALEKYEGWDIAFGGGEEGGDNFVLDAAGTYKVTLEVELLEGEFVGVASYELVP